MKNYPFVGDIFYFGKYINATFVPWHYFFVWFSITTPLVFFTYNNFWTYKIV